MDGWPFAQFLVFVVFQAILELMKRLIYRLDCFDAVPAKIVGGVLQMFLGPS